MARLSTTVNDFPTIRLWSATALITHLSFVNLNVTEAVGFVSQNQPRY